MKICNLICALLFFSQLVISQPETVNFKKSSLSIGEKIEFKSQILGEERVLNIYLPNGYSPDSLKTYPVIYLLDGSIDEDFIHISGLVQFGSFSWIKMIPETIVVGISNVDRKRDFTYPTRNLDDKKNFPTTGQSKNFIDFIENELLGFIDQNYKTNSSKTIIGQSLGGLLASEILLKKPGLFTHYIIISPSLWWDDKSLFDLIPDSTLSPKSIFIGVGKEGYGMEEDAEEFYDQLNKIKSTNTNLYFEYFEKQDHGDVLHLAVYHAFEKLFNSKTE